MQVKGPNGRYGLKALETYPTLADTCRPPPIRLPGSKSHQYLDTIAHLCFDTRDNPGNSFFPYDSHGYTAAYVNSHARSYPNCNTQALYNPHSYHGTHYYTHPDPHPNAYPHGEPCSYAHPDTHPYAHPDCEPDSNTQPNS